MYACMNGRHAGVCIAIDLIIFLAYPFFFVDTLAYLDGPHTVFIIANGFNNSFQFCGGLFKCHAHALHVSDTKLYTYFLAFMQ